MKIYSDELSIAQLIEKSGSVAVACSLDTKDFEAEANIVADKWEKDYMERSLSSDLMFVPCILVTTNWNLNDDVFSIKETWKARNSPRYKPANMDHMGSEDTENKIIGVIAECEPVDKEMKAVYAEYDDENNEEIPPEFFHILIGIAVWEKYFPETSESIKKKAASGEMYVSMEALFPDFGYALKRTDDEEAPISLLQRVDATAWLSKHLKAYGGTGLVKIDNQEYRVGRWLRDITFSGVGFVEKPGNPSSVIFKDHIISKNNKPVLANMQEVENIEKFTKKEEISVSHIRKAVKHSFDR